MLEKIDLLKKIGIDPKEYDYDKSKIIIKIEEMLHQMEYDISELLKNESINVNSLYELLDEYLFFTIDRRRKRYYFKSFKKKFRNGNSGCFRLSRLVY